MVPTARDAAVDEEDEEGEAKVRDMVNVVDDHLLASLFNRMVPLPSMQILLLLESVTYWL